MRSVVRHRPHMNDKDQLGSVFSEQGSGCVRTAHWKHEFVKFAHSRQNESEKCIPATNVIN